VVPLGKPQEEPSAGKPLARICEGDVEWLNYSTIRFGSLLKIIDSQCVNASNTRYQGYPSYRASTFVVERALPSSNLQSQRKDHYDPILGFVTGSIVILYPG
jgi:hypothetical protein